MNMNAIKTNNGKLVAAVAVLALVVCALAVAVPSVDAETFDTTDVTIPSTSSDSVAIIDASKEDAADQFTTALGNNSIKEIVIKMTAPAGTAGAGNPTVLDLTNTPVVIGSDKTVYIGSAAAKNGFWDEDAVGGATNIADNSTLQVKFGDLTVQGKLYNVLGQNKNTSGIWVEKLTLNGSGILFSTCAVNGTLSERNGFFTSSASSTGNTPSVFTHLYSAKVDSIAPYVNSMNYGGLDLTGAKAIVSYGNTTIAADDAKNTNVANTLLYVNNNSVMTIADDANITVKDITIKSKAQVNLYGNLTGSDSVTNDGKVNILASDAGLSVSKQGETIKGTGSIDTSAVMKDATLGGDLETSTEFGPNQTVTVTSNLNLLENTVLTIKGKLIIPEGMTVTIEEGAQLIIDGQTAVVENNGTILVQSTTATGSTMADKGGLVINGGKFTNNGTVDAQYLPTGTVTEDKAVITIGNATFENKGTVNIGTDSKLTITGGKFSNAAGAVLSMSGTIAGNVDNAGTVNFSGVASGNVNINLTAVDAVANINAVTGNVYITDNGFKSTTKTEFANVSAVDTVGITGTAGNTAGGIVVKAITFTDDANNDGKKETYKGLDVSGTFTVVTTSGDANKDSSTFELSGQYLFVSETLNVGAGTTFKLGAASPESKITVSGTLNITAASSSSTDSKFLVTGVGTTKIDVSGEIVSLTPVHTVDATKIKVNAAMYTTVANAITTYHYTTLEAAVVAVADATTKVVDVYGEITVNENVEIINGMTVRMTDGSKMRISENADVTIVDGGKINMVSGNEIDVEGSLYAAVERTGITGTGTIKSQVKSTSGTDALYTNLADAMADAQSGDVIKLNNKEVTLRNTSFVIKEGVTVDTNKQKFTVEGSTLTIDGTLFINDSTYEVKDFTDGYTQKSTVTLNGYLKNTSEMVYSSAQDEFPAGAYYEITENGVPYYYITTVANAASIIGSTEDDTVTINGKVAMGTVAFTGVEDYPAHVIIAAGAEVTSGDITLNTADLLVQSGAQFTGSITNGDGNVDVKMVGKTTVTGSSATTAYPGTATFTSAVNDEGADVLTVTGVATLAEMTFSGNVTAGAMTVDKLTVDGTTTVSGTANVKSALYVNGTVNIISGMLTAETDSFITGTVDAAVPSAESNNSGQADLGNMYVGISKDDKGNLAAGSAGTVTGNVTADIAYVSTNSSVPEDMTTGGSIVSTQFYVNDELWMTAYTADAANNKAKVPNAPVTDAKFIGWNDADGVLAYYADSKTKPADSKAEDLSGGITVGAHDGKLYANVDYKVYNVTIRTDGGIKAVAIDGNILAQTNSNEFSVDGLTAGQHTVSYTLKNGYQGEATLSADGITVSGMTFTLSGDYSNEFYLSLSGTEPATYTDGDSGMGLTEILLIILVVLIVIMAIMVALRLMRS